MLNSSFVEKLNDPMKRWMIYTLVGVLVAGLIGFLAWKSSERKADAILLLPVAGAEIRVEQFRPPGEDAASQSQPAILMLHGMDGPEKYGRYYRAYARELSDAGFQVFYVHYFDGSPYADLLGLSEEELGKTILRDRDAWIAGVVKTFASLSEREDVDPQRMGMLGFSLGGFVSLAATEKLVQSEDGPQPAAVVEFFSGLFEDGRGHPVVGVDHFPPTLILHGEQDQRVPVAKAYELDKKLTAADVPHELKTYPDKGHGLLGESAARRTIIYFQAHLQ